MTQAGTTAGAAADGSKLRLWTQRGAARFPDRGGRGMWGAGSLHQSRPGLPCDGTVPPGTSYASPCPAPQCVRLRGRKGRLDSHRLVVNAVGMKSTLSQEWRPKKLPAHEGLSGWGTSVPWVRPWEQPAGAGSLLAQSPERVSRQDKNVIPLPLSSPKALCLIAWDKHYDHTVFCLSRTCYCTCNK